MAIDLDGLECMYSFIPSEADSRKLRQSNMGTIQKIGDDVYDWAMNTSSKQKMEAAVSYIPGMKVFAHMSNNGGYITPSSFAEGVSLYSDLFCVTTIFLPEVSIIAKSCVEAYDEISIAAREAMCRSSEEMVTLYRGTVNGTEIDIIEETGFALSDAARTTYVETEGCMIKAMEASADAHTEQMQFWDNSLDMYKQAHAEFGTELKEIAPRSLVSFTEDYEIALYFAKGDASKVFETQIPKSLFEEYKQTLKTSTESECTLPHAVEVKLAIPK
jgi:hypothetical protein